MPNAAGVRRMLRTLGGPQATLGRSRVQRPLRNPQAQGRLDRRRVPVELAPADTPEAFRRIGNRYLVVQDILPNALTDSADVVLPAAAWAEKDGTWENFAGKLQAFAAAVAAAGRRAA